MNQESSHTRHSRVIWLLILCLLIGVVVGVLTIKLFSSSSLSFPDDTYQAVFLSNNQVYFGKLSEPDSKYPVLTNVYYIQAFAAQDLSKIAKSDSQLQLVKLGSELHQPQNVMHINRNQILFIETLKSDSQIVKSISDFERNKTQ